MSDNPNLRPPLTVRDGAYEGVVHTHLDENGVAWIDDTNVKVAEIVWDKRGGYATAEEIHKAHPDVSLAQIHAALAFYYDHKAEMDDYMERAEREVTELREQAAGRLTRQELEERLRRKALAGTA